MLYQAYEAASTGGSYKKVFEKLKTDIRVLLMAWDST